MPTQVTQLPRKVQLVYGAALSAPGNIAVPGSLQDNAVVYSNDPAVLQSNPDFSLGLQGTVVGNRSISLEEFMGLLFLITSNLGYSLQSGVPEWNADTTYYANNICRGPGTSVLYRSLTGGNLNNPVTDSNNWQACVSSVPAAALMSGAQLVAIDTNGHKINFNSKVIDPDGCYSNANAQYTAPVTGFYSVTANMQIDNTSGNAALLEFSMRVCVNGIAVRSKGESVANPPGARWYPAYAGMIPLTAGDVVEIQLAANDGTNTGQVTVGNADWSISKTC